MPQQTIAKFIATFNEIDPRKRRAAIDALYVDDCEYTDPQVSLRGRDAIEAFVAQVRAQFPAARFALAGAVDAHHDRARFTWHVIDEGAKEPFAVGFDVAVLDGGRIRQVYGFLDMGPSQAKKKIVERYLTAWNETDPVKRREILASVFTSQSSYTDPLASVKGLDGIDAFISGVQTQFKGVAFVLGETFDTHHDQARFTWNAIAEGVLEPVAIGFDVAIFEGDRIRDVHGFLDRAPAGVGK